jgi:hypothetical protein
MLVRLAHELLCLSSSWFLQTCIVLWARWHSYTACTDCTGLLSQQCCHCYFACRPCRVPQVVGDVWTKLGLMLSLLGQVRSCTMFWFVVGGSVTIQLL